MRRCAISILHLSFPLNPIDKRLERCEDQLLACIKQMNLGKNSKPWNSLFQLLSGTALRAGLNSGLNRTIG